MYARETVEISIKKIPEKTAKLQHGVHNSYKHSASLFKHKKIISGIVKIVIYS
jgi:hypothetical protein